MKIDLWYPPRTNIECVTAYGSFLPIFLYYHTRLTEWGLYFRSCKVCGRVFLAKSQKYTLCSDKCRKKQGTQAKRDFDARAVEIEYDHIYKNEAQRWLHHIHRMEKSIDYTPEKAEAFVAALEASEKDPWVRVSGNEKYTIETNHDVIRKLHEMRKTKREQLV